MTFKVLIANFTSDYEVISFIIQLDFATIDLIGLGRGCSEGRGGGGGGGRCCNGVSLTVSVSCNNDDELQHISFCLPDSLSTVFSCCL